MDQKPKPVIWLGTSLDEVRSFPREAQKIAGDELLRVQYGEDPVHWRPMTTVGPGVREIRVHTQAAHRVMYAAHFREAVYVLHAFEKRSQKTSPLDIETTRRRLALLSAQRQRR